jgi:hypothetical protein
MVGGKIWTEAENRLLQEMLEKGANLEDIVKSGKFEERSAQAIEKQAQRLGVFVGQKKKVFVGQAIGKAEIPNFEDVVSRYVDAFNRLCEKSEFTREELERFRLIFMAAWKYRGMFRDYEEFGEVKADIERLKEQMAQLFAQKDI